MTGLLPCPFCGGEAITIQEHGWWVVCTDCSAEVGFEGMTDTSGCYGSYQTEAEAIAAWNTRYHSEFEKKVIKAWKEIQDYTERTCRNVDEEYPYFECSECGCHAVVGYGGSGTGLPNYCPNCGARVTPKNSETTPKVVSE